MEFKYFLKILLIFLVIILINYIILNCNVITEGLETLIIKSNEAFCKTHNGFNLEKSCNKLTKNNCNKLSCCSWSNKCKAVNKNGIIFDDN